MSQPPIKRRARHALKTGDRRSPVLTTVTSAVLAASIAAGLGAGAASAVEQGGTNPGDSAPEQGGTTPEQSAPEQGGTTPTPEPAPAPPAATSPGPGSIPGPPQEAPYVEYTPQAAPQQYEDAYNPVPNAPLQAPKRVAPVRPIAPPPNKIRVGNFITPIPRGMNHRDVNSINAWSAYGEAKIAQNLIAIGVPKDKASRQAASTIIGVMIGGTAGAAALALPTAAAGALLGIPAGAAAGAVTGAVIGTVGATIGGPLAQLGSASALAGTGAVIGLAAGPIVGGIGGAVVGGVAGAAIGGTLGGALAYALGAGDPGAKPKEPWKQDQPEAPKPKPLPNPGGNQFELHLPQAKASQSGLPAVDYVVNLRGDVKGKVGNQEFGWSVEQAMAPYKVLGPGAEKTARQLTKQGTAQLQSVLPGVQVLWPQETPAALGLSQ